MAKFHCALCGREVGVFDRVTLSLCQTYQSLCQECGRIYHSSSPSYQAMLREKILSSPDLADRETVQKNLPAYRASEEKRRAEQEQLLVRQEHQWKVLSCCGQPMTALGVSEFQLGKYTWFWGDWSNLMSGAMELAVYRCDCCGQIKFFDPTFVPEVQK